MPQGHYLPAVGSPRIPSRGCDRALSDLTLTDPWTTMCSGAGLDKQHLCLLSAGAAGEPKRSMP